MAPPTLDNPKLWIEFVDRLGKMTPADRQAGVVWAVQLVSPDTWFPVSVSSLPVAYKAFLLAAPGYAGKIAAQRYAVSDFAWGGDTRAKVFDGTRAARFAGLWTGAQRYLAHPVSREKAAALINWFVDEWKTINYGDQKYHQWDPNPFEDWGWEDFKRDTKKHVETVALPVFVKLLSDILVADWILSADSELPAPKPKPPQQQTPPITVFFPGGLSMNPQYFAILFASAAPLVAGVAPTVFGPFTSPQGATQAAGQLAQLVSQFGGYALGQGASYLPAQGWQILSSIPGMPQQQQKSPWGF